MTALNEENLNRVDIEIKHCSLETIATDLAECDDSICNALVDAKSEEYEKIEEYREKLDVARIRLKAYFEKLFPISETQKLKGKKGFCWQNQALIPQKLGSRVKSLEKLKLLSRQPMIEFMEPKL
ncbi:hypothetical protein TNCT_537901 [Trichonephila clavata]|uniref:Uncharacterized protein n=1 Tax=Trichonephila clavata TaxID=2740835 RepID=A0A8X6L9L2_TRICU|nr:hypothetical protein TNCT_537901 [Trichonephila clavata]